MPPLVGANLIAPCDQRLGVQAVSPHHERCADAARVDELFGIGVGRIVAPHEPQHENLVRVRGDDLLRVFAFGDVDAERLLAENVEPGLQPGLDLRHMQPGWRAQEDRVQAFVLQHFSIVRVPDGSGEAHGCPFQFLRHDAAHSGQLNAGCSERDVLRMPVAQASQANHAESDRGHAFSS